MPEQPPKTHNVEAKTTAGQNMSLLKTVTNTFWQKNWWLVLIYLLACVAGAYVSSLPDIDRTAGFWASIAFSVVETAIGLFAIVKVIKITKEVQLRKRELHSEPS
jgi:hypothetical protein